MQAIEVEAVEKSFGKLKALAGVDFQVAAGSVLGLLGHNGAGKTTLVRILATLLPPDGGRVRVGGYDVTRYPIAARRLVGLAGQHAAVDEALTGRENLQLVGRLYRLSARETARRSDEVLEQLSLTEAAGRPVRTYSGGMRRRLDLGASLVGRPAVLLLDEPSTGLDPAARLELWGLVRDMAERGTAVLLTTQTLEEADYLAEDIVVLDHGQVVAHGTPAELKARLGDQTITVTLSDRADLTEAVSLLRPLSSAAPSEDRVLSTVTLQTPGGSAGLAGAVRVLDDARIDLADVTVRAPSLEDVYLSLTQQTASTTTPTN
ncbi:ATP-binding cassette domain-containing protein [Nocardia sp. CDC153]|uniref:ATP-binding cassette domain-containing protein n=1 Tax=Nocardia sp. CDC153 TaxID=3112167 RepID=UPI002DB5FDEF|nr:ATP-binding cassette domain-containing protein [Nocardia sp. CDC153]MEC3952031.1 ATP-binding cassette domain-containing protein [Nocardia sp. CDC153]